MSARVGCSAQECRGRRPGAPLSQFANLQRIGAVSPCHRPPLRVCGQHIGADIVRPP